MLGLYSCNLREGLQFCRWVFGSGYFQHNIDIVRYCTFCIARGIEFSVCLLYNFFFSIFFLEHIICWEYSRYQAGFFELVPGSYISFCQPPCTALYSPDHQYPPLYISYIFLSILFITCITYHVYHINNLSQIYFFLPATLHSSILPRSSISTLIFLISFVLHIMCIILQGIFIIDIFLFARPSTQLYTPPDHQYPPLHLMYPAGRVSIQQHFFYIQGRLCSSLYPSHFPKYFKAINKQICIEHLWREQI